MRIERRQHPRFEIGARYRRVRQEIDPPALMRAAAEGFFSWLEAIAVRLRKLSRAPSRARRTASSAP